MTNKPLLKLSDVKFERWHPDASFRLSIGDISFLPKQRYAIVGESGAGKSSFLSLLGLLHPPTSAECFMFSPEEKGTTDIMTLWRNGEKDRIAALRRRHIGHIVQTGALIPFLTVGQNIGLPSELNGQKATFQVLHLSDMLGITPLLTRHPRDLSVGQRQRVAVARAIIHKPQLILADEPTAALDRHNAHLVMTALIDMCSEARSALVCASHDLNLMETLGFTILECSPQSAKQHHRSSIIYGPRT